MNFWNSSPGFQKRFMAELLKDCLYEEISGICSVFLIVAKTHEKKDHQLVAWLQENVIGPVVFDHVELSVYQELWDQARILTESQKKPLAK